MATIAKAYQLQAIDMVCIDYKDMTNLGDESLEARQMGYDGKQAIHPAQVNTIQKTFSPSEEEIDRARKIRATYDEGVEQNKGAVGFMEGDSMIMVDAPLVKIADNILAKANALERK
jgi:citrate lyase subunit beta-like protein